MLKVDFDKIYSQVIQERYKNLGHVTFHEYGVATLFFMCVFLWIFRRPGFVVGWSELMTDVLVFWLFRETIVTYMYTYTIYEIYNECVMRRDLRDSVPVIFASILMFFIPKDPSFIYSYSQDRKKLRKSISIQYILRYNNNSKDHNHMLSLSNILSYKL